jgi:hypothetical protein
MKSLNDVEIIPGSYITYATRYGSTLDMKIGKVLELVIKNRYSFEKGDNAETFTRIRVRGAERSWRGEWVLLKPSLIERVDRVIVIRDIPNELSILFTENK